MIALRDGLSRVYRLAQESNFAALLHATSHFAAGQLAGIAMRPSRLDRQSWRARLVQFLGRSVAPGSILGDVWRIREVRRQLDAATADLHQVRACNDALNTKYSETRRQLDVSMTTISHLRRIEVSYQSLVDEHAALVNEHAALVNRHAALVSENKALVNEHADTRQQLRAGIEDLRQLRAQLEALTANDLETKRQLDVARSGVQAFVDELQNMLFLLRKTTAQSQSAASLVLWDAPVQDAIATLVNLSEPLHGARPFQYVLPFLAPLVPFPIPWPVDMQPLKIVDVGSQELAFESDVFAPLRNIAPVEVVGFDPFARVTGGPNRAVDVRRSDGGTTRTFKHLLGDGGVATLHVNRFDATSSTLPTNHELTRPFGLLDLSLQTVETRELPSSRLDDFLTEMRAVDLLKVDVQGAAHSVLDHGRRLLQRTLIVHVEAEFAPIYLGERLFADIDALLREAGFSFVDFFSLGRQRYTAFDGSPARAFHRGRTLWADCIYGRGLDTPGALNADELFRQALIMHACYNKQDLTAELLARADALSGTSLGERYISSMKPEKA